MGSVLIERWLSGAERISVVDDASVSEVREAVRARGAAVGLSSLAIEKLVAAVSELVRNQLAHAIGGEVGLRMTDRGGVAGLEVIAADRGHGIADPANALRGVPRVAGSLGVGLSAAARQVDELDLDIRHGAGTSIALRVFTQPVRRSEIGILARPHPDETVIGDGAVALRSPTGLWLGIVDGLGHGPLACEAADGALETMIRQPLLQLADLFQVIHTAVVGTRGAVMAIAHVTDQIEHASVGNISTRVIAIDGTARPLSSTPGTLGSAFPRRVHVDHVTLQPGELLVMSSDGLTSRVDLTHEPAVIRQHPIIVAQHLLARFARGTDDAIVAVVR